MPNTVYHYDENALKVLAILFSPGFIYLGEKEWLAALAKAFDFTNKKILNFGLNVDGGVLAIAAQTQAQVTGMDTLPLLGKFDFIFTAHHISHYKEKTEVFAEFHRVMRLNGIVECMDWFSRSNYEHEAVSAFFSYVRDHVYLNPPQDYLHALEKNNFGYVNFKDTTKSMQNLCEILMNDLKTEYQEEIITHFGAEYFESWLEYWQLLHAALQSGELITGQVHAVKVK